MAFAGFTDQGFPGTIADSSDFLDLQRAAGRFDSFPFLTHMRASIVQGQTRTVAVSAGLSTGAGVSSEMEEVATVVLDNQPSGVRWDVIYVERVFGADAASTGTRVGVKKGTSAPAVPALTRVKGAAWQTPIALAQIVAGETLPQRLIDLRVIAELGHAYTIFDDLALGFIDAPGVTVYNATTGAYHVRSYTAGGARQWAKLSTESSPVAPRYGAFLDYTPQNAGPKSTHSRNYHLVIPSKPYPRLAAVLASIDFNINPNSNWQARLILSSSTISSPTDGTILNSTFHYNESSSVSRETANLFANIAIPAGVTYRVASYMAKISGGSITTLDAGGRAIDVSWTEITSGNQW